MELTQDVDNYIQLRKTDLQIKAESPIINSFLSLSPNEMEYSSVKNKALSLITNWQKYDSISSTSYAVLDGSGIILLDTEPKHVGQDESTYPYFEESLNSNTPKFSVISMADTDLSSYILAKPIRNQENKIIGLLRIQINNEFLDPIIITFAEQIGPGSYGIVFDKTHISSQISTSTSPFTIDLLSNLTNSEKPYIITSSDYLTGKGAPVYVAASQIDIPKDH